MERLWRPWRMAYIKGEERHTDCFLCDKGAASDGSRDAEDLVLARGAEAFVLLNLYPYNTGHLLIAPYRHVGDLEDLTHDEQDEMWAWTRRSIAAHRRTSQPQGFNVGLNLGSVAGAGLPGHIHLHVVPRWGGDTNFMPVVGDTRVLPEMLEQTYDALKPVLDDVVADEGR